MLEELKRGVQQLLNAENITDEQKKQLEYLRKQQELLQQKEKEERERRLKVDQATLSVYEQLEAFLQREALKSKGTGKREETVTISQAGFDYADENFDHAYLLVSDYDAGTILNLDYLGVRYSQVLYAGLNSLDILPNTRLSVKENVQVVLIRTSERLEIKKNNAPAIIESVELTGNTTHNFKAYVTDIAIVNLSTTDALTLKIGDVSIKVAPSEGFEGTFPKTQIAEITAIGSYKLIGKV